MSASAPLSNRRLRQDVWVSVFLSIFLWVSVFFLLRRAARPGAYAIAARGIPAYAGANTSPRAALVELVGHGVARSCEPGVESPVPCPRPWDCRSPRSRPGLHQHVESLVTTVHDAVLVAARPSDVRVDPLPGLVRRFILGGQGRAELVESTAWPRGPARPSRFVRAGHTGDCRPAACPHESRRTCRTAWPA